MRITGFLTILIMPAFIVCMLEAAERSEVIDQEMDCVVQSLQKNEEIGWNDICYSWDKPRDVGREKAIDSALNNYEKSRIMNRSHFSHPDYPRLSDSWGKTLSQHKERPQQSDEEIEAWLKKDYPYFYKEHMEQKEIPKNYYGDEALGGEDSRLSAFLKNIDYGVIFQSDVEPTYYFETVFPILQSQEKAHTLFSHDRISVISDQDGSFTAGLGYRYYDKERPYILGMNTFYDFQQNGDHYRMGYGAEFIGEDIEARVNFYDGLSPQRSSGVNFEQAVDGLDTELGMTVPKFHLAKVFGGYQWYDYNHGDDRQGWKTRLELTPAPSLRLNIEALDENESPMRYRFDGRFNFNFTTFNPQDIVSDIKGESLEPTRIDFEDRLLQRVEREFAVRTERWVGELVIEPIEDNLSIVTIAIVSPCVLCSGPSVDADGVLEPGEGFEINVTYTNLADQPRTSLEIVNATVSNTTDFSYFASAANVLDDAGPGETVFTENPEDLDYNIAPGAALGAQTFISFDIASDQGVESFTFGPIIVGFTANGHQFSPQ